MIPTLGILMSLNDPQWGNRGGNDGGDSGGPRRPNQGPPDLEELWRDFNQKMNKWLGGGASKRPAGDVPPSGGGEGPVPGKCR